MASAPRLVVTPGAGEAAAGAARAVSAALAEALDQASRASVAFSGGSTPLAMFDHLAGAIGADVDWARIDVYQVDERVVPADDPARNAAGLHRHLVGPLGLAESQVHLLPVEAADLEAAARAHGADLPRFDVVHLGLGDDAHTASWPPGHPVVDRHDPARDEWVAVVGPYRGHRRLTLTPAALARAGAVVFLVTGADKRDALARLVAGDPAIPATAVPLDRTVVYADAACGR